VVQMLALNLAPTGAGPAAARGNERENRAAPQHKIRFDIGKPP
jgi:hypothetical protein